MNFLFDTLPILVFFVAYKMGDINTATIAAIIASLLALFAMKIKTGIYQKIHLVSFFVLLIFGSATILLENDIFVKLKPTVVYWILALAVFYTQFLSSKTLLQRIAGNSIQVPERIWRQLNLSWGLFFTTLGSMNLYIAYNFATTTWVNFKVFGTLGLTILFFVIQAMYTAKYLRTPNGNN